MLYKSAPFENTQLKLALNKYKSDIYWVINLKHIYD